MTITKQFYDDMQDLVNTVAEVQGKLEHIEQVRKRAVTRVFPQVVQEKNKHYSEYRISILKRDLLKMQGALAKARRHAQRVSKLKTNVSLLLYEVDRDQAA